MTRPTPAGPLEDQQFGFVTEGRLIVSLINLQAAGYTEETLPDLYQRLEERLPQIPGVLSASLSTYSPLEGNNWSEYVSIHGKPPDFSGTAPSWLRVGPGYFQTIGTRLLEGRLIDERDRPGAPRVAVVNETLARRFFPRENAIGHHFGMSDLGHSGDYEIVGIVEDTKYQDTRGPAYPTFFLPLLQVGPGEPLRGWVSTIELHVAGRPDNLEPVVRKAIAKINPNLTVLRMVSFDAQVARNFNQERLIARLAEVFGILALILVCVGLYGVTAYVVTRRTNEIGIRMALGDRQKGSSGVCPPQCTVASRHRPGHRHTRCSCERAYTGGRTVWREELQSVDLGSSRSNSRILCVVCGIPSRAACDQD